LNDTEKSEWSTLYQGLKNTEWGTSVFEEAATSKEAYNSAVNEYMESTSLMIAEALYSEGDGLKAVEVISRQFTNIDTTETIAFEMMQTPNAGQSSGAYILEAYRVPLETDKIAKGYILPSIDYR
jgi:hypothetical protein